MRTLYRNGRVHTTSARDATALLVQDELIAWIGDESGAAAHVGAQVVDLAGGFVTPSFVDAHVHATSTGLALSGLDLSATRSLAEALDLLEAAARRGRGRPVLGGGWDDSTWPERRAPSRAEIDRAAYGGAVYLARVDVHSAAVSSVLAAAVPGLAALPGYSPDEPLVGAAHDRARESAVALLSAADRTGAQRVALQHAASLGIGCVHEMAGPSISSADDLAGLSRLAADEQLPEVVGYWGELGGVQTALELGAVGAAGDLFCDGSLGSQTAALHEPYADRPDTSGLLEYDTAELVDHIVQCSRAGLQTGFHAIGDAAIDQVLAAFEAAGRTLGRIGGAGHRLEHAEMVRDPDRLAASGLLASVQPGFDAAWGGPDGLYARRLGTRRAAGLNRFGDLAAAGVALAFGSDAPVTAMGPWEAIRAAAYPNEPDAALSVRAGFAAHTRGGWRAAGRDGGVLTPGARADFAVWRAGELAVDAPDDRVARWSTDPRSAVAGLPDVAPGAELPACVLTVLRGRVIFDGGIGGYPIDR